MIDEEDSTNAMFSVDLSNLPPFQMSDDSIYDDIATTATCLPGLCFSPRAKSLIVG
jgi:hypothetical protein